MKDQEKKERKQRVFFTEERRQQFLNNLATTGLFYKSANMVEISPKVIYETMEKDPEFRAAVEKAKADFADFLEDRLLQRAVEGVEEGIYYQGVQVGTNRVFSDRLMELAIKAHKPAYRDKSAVDMNVSGGLVVLGADLEDDEVEALARKREREAAERKTKG